MAGDDVWRFIWEGRIQLHGFNPYELAPDSPVLAALRDADWTRINHQNIPAIYPPLTELIFATLARFHVSVTGYKLLFAAADLGVVAVLRSLLKRCGGSADAAVWYAWNPLIVYVSIGAAHFDSLMMLPLLGAVWCLDRFNGENESANAWVSALLLGLAIACKAVPLVLLPVWFFALGWRYALLTLPLAILLTPALALFYGFPHVRVFGVLEHFESGYRVNDALWWFVDPANRASAVCAFVTAAVCLALAVWLRRDWRRATLWVLGAALLLSPVVHAWYVVWIIPYAVWRGESARAWIVLSISVFGYFLLWEINHASGRPWVEPLWLRAFVYLPPLLFLGWKTLARRQSTDAVTPGVC